MTAPSIGLMVSFVTPEGNARPAMIVDVNDRSRVADPQPGQPAFRQTVDLQVFTAGRKDADWLGENAMPLVLQKEVPYAEAFYMGRSKRPVDVNGEQIPMTWHWPAGDSSAATGGAQ